MERGLRRSYESVTAGEGLLPKVMVMGGGSGRVARAARVGSGVAGGARTAAGGALGSFAGSIGLMALVGMQTTTIVLTAA